MAPTTDLILTQLYWQIVISPAIAPEDIGLPCVMINPSVSAGLPKSSSKFFDIMRLAFIQSQQQS